MRAADGLHEFDGDIIARSKKAVLFRGDYWEKPEHAEGVWLPLSQCTLEVDPTDPQRGTVLVPGWLVKKNELAGDE